MKTLYLVRHAKSAWNDLTIEDYERPLLPKGIKRARKVAKHLLNEGAKPHVIVSSHAVRAVETAKIFADILGYEAEKILIDENLYFSGEQAMENILYGSDNKIEDIMLVGHNPDMTRFANEFLADEQKIDYLPTSGVVCVKFQTEQWQKIMLAKREIAFVIIPKTL
jgi:phosphohistidine phosphatase